MLILNQSRAPRVGASAIVCALLLRLWAAKVPEKAVKWLSSPSVSSFLIYLETGHHVRFSSSAAPFFPGFTESPPAATIPAPEPVLPVFSGAQELEIFRATGKEPDLEALLSAPLNWQLRGDSPTVLILHTHSTESYTKAGESYRETARWRTLDEEYNMLSIGAYVQQLLQEQGIPAVQDRSIHDYPSYNGSYQSAREALARLLEEYPTVQLVLDLHRDASGTDQAQLRTLAAVEGCDSAQLMVVLGTNHPDYEENLSLGLKLHAQLEAQNPGITRPLQLRHARYNQDLHPHALLIEVGAAGNTHSEAMPAAQALADAVAALAEGANPVPEGEPG